PPVFTCLRANGTVSLIGWDDLRFTLEESKQIILSKARIELTEEAFASLHNITRGWAAGLTLLLEQTKQADAGPDLATRLGEISQKAVFDYFAGEIFDKLDSEITDFLLMSSFLPKMTVQMAERMTHQENADHILNILNRNNFFTEKHQTA